MKARLQHPMYTAAALAAANPVLLKGEVVYESDTHKHKIGDGTAAWNALPYESSGGPAVPAGPFPGYRLISRGGEAPITMIGTTASVTFFEPLDPAAIIDRHLFLEAEITGGFQTVTSVPLLLPRIYNTANAIPVVDFTTSNPDLLTSNYLYLNIRVHLTLTLAESTVTGCQLSLMNTFTLGQSGGSTFKTLNFKWHGIYLEEL